ncbi:MAG: hypothetical protein AABO58_01130 [Acidobacteriota bacterium]
MRRIAPLHIVLSAVIVLALDTNGAFAQGGPLINGLNHTGVIQVGGLDTWTFQATNKDRIVVRAGEVQSTGADPNFRPWIRLRGPDGASLGSQALTDNPEIDVRAPSTGTYSVLVTNAGDFQAGAATYLLTLAKSPGSYTFSAGDEGGPIANGTYAGVIAHADLDPWTFQAALNDNITVRLGKVAAGGSDPGFHPELRLIGPDGALLDQAYLSNSPEVNVRAPTAGIYAILVANGDMYAVGPGSYMLTVTGLTAPPQGSVVAAILAVVGSAQGNGAFFRTGVQIHNTRTTSISGRLIFHTQGAGASANDPSLSYTLQGGATINYVDLLPAMGISSGLGSLDVTTSGDPVPIIAARIFSDGGLNGTAGFFMEPLAPQVALQAGESAVLIAPADPVQTRLNLGVRSLETGASFLITVRDKNGAVRNTVNKTYVANFFEQVGANAYVGVTLAGSDTITISMNSGKAILYGAQTDNKTQDPSVQYFKKTF